MDLPIDKNLQKQFWDKHVEAVLSFKGNKNEYCRLHGIKPHQLYHQERKRSGWMKQKKSTDTKFAKLITEVRPTTTSGDRKLDIDPKWLAEFLCHWRRLS